MFFTVILKMGLDSPTSSIGNWALVRFVKNPPKTDENLSKTGQNWVEPGIGGKNSFCLSPV